MKIQKTIIAGGNPTLLVWDCPKAKKNEIIKRYLGEVEQVGFVEKKSVPILNMMGGELCINATIALASQLGNVGKLRTSGLDKEIKFQNKNNISYLEFSLPFKRKRNIILFPGIGFIYSDELIYQNKSKLSQLADKYSLPAFGAISYQKKRIIPLIFVKGTDSLVKETACGSGSIACSIITGNSNIIHPTGQSILVRQRGDTFIVGAKVVKIGENYD